MARSLAGSRGVIGSRRTRPKHRTSTTRRYKSSEVEVEAKTPDPDELRRLRQVHYSQTTRHKSSSSRSKNGLQESTFGKSRSETAELSKSAGKQRDRTEEYVYGTALPVETFPQEYGGERSVQNSSTKRRTIKRSASPQHETASSILNTEVTPDDSVSQIGSRRHRSRRSLRPTLRPVDGKASETTAPTKGKRDSLFGSLFSKRTPSVSTAPKTVECLTCGEEDVPAAKTAKLECDHRMCHPCLKRIFKLAVKDPAHMPPKCCTDQPIPLRHVDRLFDERWKVMFNKKLDEHRTKDRVYCPNRKCRIWIRPAYYHTSGGRRYAQCNRCNTRACLLCGMKLHKSRDCPKDPEIAKLIEQAEEQGWKRCYSCSAMVELREGCNHMTCRCTAEFCMVCGARWKTCECAWFNNTAVPAFDRLGGLPIPDPFEYLHRQLFGNQAVPRAPAAAPVRTYQQEIDQRQRQEQDDESLARRMQFATIWEDDLPPRRNREFDVLGLGNAANHFMNDDFVQETANVTINDVGDAAMGRRGERSSTRRRPAETPRRIHTGLVANFLGDQSVLGERSRRR